MANARPRISRPRGHQKVADFPLIGLFKFLGPLLSPSSIELRTFKSFLLLPLYKYMDLTQIRPEYEKRLRAFLANPRKKYLTHPKSKSARIDKQGGISHIKFGNPVQQNRQDISVVICGSQNAMGTDIKVTALRFLAECVLGAPLYFWYVGVEPVDDNYNHISFDNINFVKTDRNYREEHMEIDFSGLKSVGEIWYDNGFKKVI